MGRAYVYIVRHGETQANKDHIIQGHLDTALNEEGLQQARLVAVALETIDFSAAISSDLDRAKKTAEIILEQQAASIAIKTDERLRERYLGDLQGQTLDQLASSDSLTSNPTIEQVDAMAKRGIDWWKDSILTHVRTLSEDASPAHILVVSHGGFISQLIGALIGGRHIDHNIPNFRRTPLLNTSICQIDVLETLKGRLVKYGDVSHLVTPAAGHTIEHAPY